MKKLKHKMGWVWVKLSASVVTLQTEGIQIWHLIKNIIKKAKTFTFLVSTNENNFFKPLLINMADCPHKDAHSKRPKTKRPRDKTSQGQNVPGTKRPKGQTVPRTKHPKGQNVPRDKTSQRQNVPETKRPRDKTSQGDKWGPLSNMCGQLPNLIWPG